jgi:hypothetical protein
MRCRSGRALTISVHGAGAQSPSSPAQLAPPLLLLHLGSRNRRVDKANPPPRTEGEAPLVGDGLWYKSTTNGQVMGLMNAAQASSLSLS